MPRTVYLFKNFVLDTGAHVLMREGTALQIQEQPYQVLLGLLEADGQIVQREALHLRLWGRNTFVDFDQSLNSAVRRLRLVLGDNSRNPSYVETLSRIGFRFIPEIRKEVLAPQQNDTLCVGSGPASLPRQQGQRFVARPTLPGLAVGQMLR